MERLTQRENDKLIMVKQDNGEYIPVYWDEDNFKAIEKLATYEQLEEQGLLVRLPIALGSDVYFITVNNEIYMEYVLTSHSLTNNFIVRLGNGLNFLTSDRKYSGREKKLRRSWRNSKMKFNFKEAQNGKKHLFYG